MEQTRISAAREKLADPLRQAFLDYGYEQMTMIGLAKACGLTRRALYHHFSDKEQAFRFVLEVDTRTAMDAASEAGRSGLARKDDPVDILTSVMDARYAANRRKLAGSPHATEINDQAFRRARPMMIEAAIAFQAQLADLLVDMERAGLITLRPGTRPADLAQALADGARGSNQSLPPVNADDLPMRYKNILGAILFGTADRPG
jgi:AcrR family transcriptional regulator